MPRTCRRLFVALIVTVGLAPVRVVLAQGDPIVVGVVIDGPWERNDEIRALFRQEILTLTEGEFDVRFPPEKEIIADWSRNGVAAALDRLLADPEVDLLLSVGPLGSVDVARRGNLPRPTIGAFTLQPELSGLPRAGAGSGVENLAYVTHSTTFARDLEVFRDATGARSLAVMAPATFLEVVPERRAAVERAADLLGLRLSFIAVGRSATDALEALPPDVDGVYLAPLLQLPATEQQVLFDGLRSRRLPSFSIMGRPDVERGALMSLMPDSYFPRVARRVALDVQRILLGQPPEEVPVDFRLQEAALVNMRVAREIGVVPPWEILGEAELIGDLDARGPSLTVSRAVEEAVSVNLDLAAQRREVAAGAADVGRARSSLLPRVDLSALATRVEEETADASFGIVPEHRTTGSLTGSQLLWSEPAWANLQIQRRVQEARVQDEEALRLDIAQAAATSYFNALAAETIERVEKENVAVTRSHLAMAEARRDAGVATPAEVFRWQSELATARRRLVDATASVERAHIALARVLHRPQGERFRLVDVTADDPTFVTGLARFEAFVADPLRVELFADFLVQDAIATVPEIRRLDALVRARERALGSATRAFFSPTVALQGEFRKTLDESTGGFGLELPDGLLPMNDDETWSIGVSLSLPLWTSGERIADRSQAADELAALRFQRAAIAERVEQRVRSALEDASASYAGIELARESAKAAARSLELVEDGYARGVLSILDILDAQNAALAADLAAAASEYRFLIDLMEVERASGRLDFFRTRDEIEAWLDRIERTYEREGLPL